MPGRMHVDIALFAGPAWKQSLLPLPCARVAKTGAARTCCKDPRRRSGAVRRGRVRVDHRTNRGCNPGVQVDFVEAAGADWRQADWKRERGDGFAKRRPAASPPRTVQKLRFVYLAARNDLSALRHRCSGSRPGLRNGRTASKSIKRGHATLAARIAGAFSVAVIRSVCAMFYKS